MCSKCRAIYPLCVIKAADKKYFMTQLHFKNVTDDMLANGIDISAVIADNPKRALIRNSLNHASTYPCEYCFARGLKCTLDLNFKKTCMAVFY